MLGPSLRAISAATEEKKCVNGKSGAFCVGVLFGPWPRSLFCFAVVSLWRNANLAGGFACRRIWWFVVLFLFDDLPFSYETKAFHAEFSNLFTRLSQC